MDAADRSSRAGRCPGCRTELGPTETLDGEARDPRLGDYYVCGDCGLIIRFKCRSEQPIPRRANELEIGALPAAMTRVLLQLKREGQLRAAQRRRGHRSSD